MLLSNSKDVQFSQTGAAAVARLDRHGQMGRRLTAKSTRKPNFFMPLQGLEPMGSRFGKTPKSRLDVATEAIVHLRITTGALDLEPSEVNKGSERRLPKWVVIWPYKYTHSTKYA